MRISTAMAMCLVLEAVLSAAVADELGAVAPFVSESAIAVLRVDVEQVAAPQVVALITGTNQSDGVHGLTGHVDVFLEKPASERSTSTPSTVCGISAARPRTSSCRQRSFSR
jgi:hypothetical protein